MMSKNYYNQTIYKIIIVFLIVVGCLLYSNSFDIPFHFDDQRIIVENNIIKNLKNFGLIWIYDPSRFVTHYSFALNYHFHGLDLFGYHFVNLMLHLSVTIAIFFLLRLTFSIHQSDSSLKDENSLYVCLFTSLIFLVHPLQTQSVVYLSQRSTLLASLCYVLCIILYVLYRKEGRPHFYILGLVTMFWGLFTKPIIVTLPFALLLYEICFFDFSWAKAKKFFLRILPFLLMALIVPLLIMQWKHKTVDISRYLEMASETSKVSRKDYLLTQFNVLMTYLRLLFVPVAQNLDYDYPISRNFFSFPTWASFCVVASILFAAFKSFAKYRLFSFAIFWIAVTLSLESSIFPISDVINEHRLYLPMMGFGLLLSLTAFKWIHHRTAEVILILVLFVFSGLTYNRNNLWRDRIGFLMDVMQKSPNKSRVHNNLAIAFLQKGDLKGAEKEYKRAIELNPDYAHPRNNLANIYFEQGRIEEAKEGLKKALEIDPKYAGAYYNLGNIYWAQRDYQKAHENYLKAVELKSSFVMAIVGLGKIHRLHGDHPRAKYYFQSAIRLNPAYDLAYVNLGDLYIYEGRHRLATQHYREALKHNPNLISTYNSLANAYDMTGQYEQAEAIYKQAIARDPKYANAYFNLANTLKKKGNIPAARHMLKQAIQLYQSEGNVQMIQKAQERFKELGR